VFFQKYAEYARCGRRFFQHALVSSGGLEERSAATNVFNLYGV
jgi:hypothetical protein